MAKKKTTTGKPANVLPNLPGAFVVMGMSASQNKKLAAAIRKKLAQ